MANHNDVLSQKSLESLDSLLYKVISHFVF